MRSLRALGLLGLTLLAAPVVAQTHPNKMARRPATRPVPATTRAATPPRGTTDNAQGQSGYAAPGEPVNVQDNGKNTPPYDGPAANRRTPSKGMTLPRKQ